MIGFPLSVAAQQFVRDVIYYLNQVFDKCYHYSSIGWHTQRFVRDVIYYLNQVFDKCYHHSYIEWHTQRFVKDADR